MAEENGKKKPERTIASLELSAVRAITAWLMKLPSPRSRLRVLRMVGDRVQEMVDERTREQANRDRAVVAELEARERQMQIPGASRADEESPW